MGNDDTTPLRPDSLLGEFTKASKCRISETMDQGRGSSSTTVLEIQYHKVFLMSEELNGYFSSVFTTEDISSLPVPDAKL